MKNAIALILLFGATVFGAEKFELRDASKIYDVTIEVEKCDEVFCEGKAVFTIFKKGNSKPFQTIRLDQTAFMLEEGKRSQTRMLYDYQSAVFFQDYNFDGAEDLAVRDGNNGGYGGPSYQIYLFAPRAKKFVNNPGLTYLAQGEFLGMFDVDAKRKVLRTFAKSGCCWHQTREYQVIRNRPRKIFELTDDATIGDDRVETTTKRLIGKRWKTTVKRSKMQDSN